jgi:hypothetical protein
MRLARHEPVADVEQGGLGKGERTGAPIRRRYLLQELVKLKTTCPGIADVRGRGACSGAPIFLGIYRSQVLPAEAQLGSRDYEQLSAGIMIPRDSKKMVQWIQAGDAGGERELTGKWSGRLQLVLISGFLDLVPRPEGLNPSLFQDLSSTSRLLQGTLLKPCPFIELCMKRSFTYFKPYKSQISVIEHEGRECGAESLSAE